MTAMLVKGVVLGLAFFLIVNLLASAAVVAVWRLGLRPDPPASRKRALFALRLFPTAASSFAVFGLFVPAWIAHEPLASGEVVGLKLAALAIVAALPVVSGLRRGVLEWRASRDLARLWAEGARPVVVNDVNVHRISHPFPVVAVVGFLRPRLFVADQVLASLSSEEWEAVAAHEAGHAGALDNLQRLLLRACPDALAFHPVAAALTRAWVRAAEEAADERAARLGPRVGLNLAEALLKVARMAPPGRSSLLPTLALHDGSDLERRVERLLEAPLPARRSGAWVAASAGCVLVLPLYPSLLRVVHALAERLLALLG